MTTEEFFAGYDQSGELYESIRREIDIIGNAGIKVSRSQIAFRRRTAFAWVWIPEKALKRKAAPLVLTFSFRERDPSPRWKEVVHPAPGRYTHHLELYSSNEIDTQVRGWLKQAWEEAG